MANYLQDIRVSGTVSIGTLTPTTSSILEVVGDTDILGTASLYFLKLTETGTETSGYILTTDVNGVASWTSSTSLGLGNGIYTTNDTVGTTRAVGITDTLTFGTNLLHLDETASRVGIGTSTPTAGFVLDVEGRTFFKSTFGNHTWEVDGLGAAAPTIVHLDMPDITVGFTNAAGFNFGSQGTLDGTGSRTYAGIQSYVKVRADHSISGGLVFKTTTNGIDHTSPMGRLTITPEGFVGVGTNFEPTNKFQVRGEGTGATTTSLLVENSVGGAVGEMFKISDNKTAILGGTYGDAADKDGQTMLLINGSAVNFASNSIGLHVKANIDANTSSTIALFEHTNIIGSTPTLTSSVLKVLGGWAGTGSAIGLKVSSHPYVSIGADIVNRVQLYVNHSQETYPNYANTSIAGKFRNNCSWTLTNGLTYKKGIEIVSTGVFSNTVLLDAKNIGLDVTVSGGDINYAALFNGGNVGIGTSTPTSKLSIKGNSNTFSSVNQEAFSSTSSTSIMELRDNGFFRIEGGIMTSTQADFDTYVPLFTTKGIAALFNHSDEVSNSAINTGTGTLSRAGLWAITGAAADKSIGLVSHNANYDTGGVESYGSTFLANKGAFKISAGLTDMVINYGNLPTNKLYFTNNGNVRAYFNANGGLFLGSAGIGHVDSGEALYIRTFGSTSATKGMVIKNSANAEKFFVRDDGMVSATDGYSIGTTLFVHATQNGVQNMGANNTFIGETVGLLANTATGLAINNTGVGSTALTSLTGGHRNTAVGQASLYQLTVGRDNTAIGLLSLFALTSATEGAVSHNTAIGSESFKSLVTGIYNAGLGVQSGANITNGTSNICIGYNTGGKTSGAYSHSIAIGALAKFTADHQFVMGEQAGGHDIYEAFLGVGVEQTIINPTTFKLGITNITSGSGTDVTSGYDFIFKTSAGTGTGLGGKHIFQVAPAGVSGTTQNAFVDAMTIQQDGVVVFRSFVKASLPTPVAGGVIRVSDEIGGDTLAYSDGVNWKRMSDGAIVA